MAQAILYLPEESRGAFREIGALRQVLAKESVGVLVAPLPGTNKVCKNIPCKKRSARVSCLAIPPPWSKERLSRSSPCYLLERVPECQTYPFVSFPVGGTCPRSARRGPSASEATNLGSCGMMAS